MQTMPDPATLRAHAARTLGTAEATAGIKIKTLTELGELQELARLFSVIWAAEEMISSELLRALGHAGNYVVGAFTNGDMVGGGVGFMGMHDRRVILHSHIVGVAPEVQGRSVGFAIKQHQRAWTLDRGITEMQWTFDPLVRRNAYFNVNKLGAMPTAYYSTFYGVMHDGVNAGDESDRMLVSWDLGSPRTIEASDGRVAAAETGDLMDRGAAVFLAERDGGPVLTGDQAPVLLCATPDDIVKLRETDLETALAWRKALRVTLGTALSEGYEVTGFTRDGHYVLERL